MEALYRILIFLAVLSILVLIESMAPARSFNRAGLRWICNFSLLLVGNLLSRLVFPLGAIGAAIYAEHQSVGLMPLLGVDGFFSLLCCFVLLDLAIYWQHRLMHVVPWLWRLHAVHHRDFGFDVSTGIRFHPVELVLSMAYKIGVVVALGAPVEAVFVFEAYLSVMALFTHANFRFSRTVDRILRYVLVTPSMHRVHHSVVRSEHDSNYCFGLSIWDRLFHSYTEAPAGGEREFAIGLEGVNEASISKHLMSDFLSPFRK